MGFSNKDEHQHHGDYEADMYTGITTFHGLVRIYNSRNWWGRTFWILVSFTAMTFFFIQSYYTVQHYHEKPTTIQSNFEVPIDGIEFPQITICNFNPVSTRKVRAMYNMSDNVQKYVMYTYLQVENLYSQVDHQDFKDLHEEYKEYIKKYPIDHNNSSFDLRTFFMDVGYDCEETFKECSFGGIMIEDCCNNSHSILTDIGKCYLFNDFGNHTWSKRQLISGAYYGLHMILDAQVDDYPTVYVENFLDSGIKFYMHPDGVIPMLSSMGSAIPQGRKGFGAVTLREYNFLGHDNWGTCKTNFTAENGEITNETDATNRAEEAEANAGKGGKHLIAKLEGRAQELEGDLEAAEARVQESAKISRNKERRCRELTFQVEEEKKSRERMHDLIGNLNQRVVVYKRQLEEAEATSGGSLSKLRALQSALEDAEERANLAENALRKMRAQTRSGLQHSSSMATIGMPRRSSRASSRLASRETLNDD